MSHYETLAFFNILVLLVRYIIEYYTNLWCKTFNNIFYVIYSLGFGCLLILQVISGLNFNKLGKKMISKTVNYRNCYDLYKLAIVCRFKKHFTKFYKKN